MTAQEIQEYTSMADNKVEQSDSEDSYEGIDIICFPGYSSWFLQKSRAMSFMWEDVNTGHQKVLFHLKWMDKEEIIFLDAGAYDHEEEILFCERIKPLIVESVEEIKNDKKVLYTLITLKTENA